MSNVCLADKFKTAANIPWQILDGNVIVLTPKEGMAHELDSIGSLIWMGVTKEQSLSQLNQQICDEFEVESSMAEQDLCSFISDLENKNMLERIND